MGAPIVQSLIHEVINYPFKDQNYIEAIKNMRRVNVGSKVVREIEQTIEQFEGPLGDKEITEVISNMVYPYYLSEADWALLHASKNQGRLS